MKAFGNLLNLTSCLIPDEPSPEDPCRVTLFACDIVARAVCKVTKSNQANETHRGVLFAAQTAVGLRNKDEYREFIRGFSYSKYLSSSAVHNLLRGATYNSLGDSPPKKDVKLWYLKEACRHVGRDVMMLDQIEILWEHFPEIERCLRSPNPKIRRLILHEDEEYRLQAIHLSDVYGDELYNLPINNDEEE